MRQAQKDWAETARDTWTHWEHSQGDQKSAGRAWKTLSLREKAALTPEATPGKGKGCSLWKSQPQKPALAFPGLYLFLGGVVPSLPLKKDKESPNAQSGDTVGMEGLWGSEAPGGSRPSSALSSVPELRTQLRRLHPGLPWWAPQRRQLVTQTQVMTSGTSVPWDSPQAHSLLSPLPFLPHQRVSGCPSDSDSEEAGSSWGPLPMSSMALAGVPAHLQRAGRARPDAPRSRPFLPKPLPAYTPKSGFPHLLALFAFSQRENIYYCNEVNNDYGMLSLLCECPLTRERFMLVLFLMSFNVQAFCWLLSLSNVPINVFSSLEHHVLFLCYI